MLHDRYKEPYGAALMIGGGEGSPADLTQPQCRASRSDNPSRGKFN